MMGRYYYSHLYTLKEYKKQQRQYQQIKAELKEKFDKQNDLLKKWLNENGLAIYHGLVKKIHEICLEENEKEGRSLDFYRGRVLDLQAVNKAIQHNNIDDLSVRAAACMKERSQGLQVIGVLMGVVAASLVFTGICTLSPFMIFTGALAVLLAYVAYDLGAEKVSTTKSTLFTRLSHEISPRQCEPSDYEPKPVTDRELLMGGL